MVSFTAPLKVWTGAEGRSHFVTVPEELSSEIKAHALGNRRGFGSVKVEATIHEITWRTSVFPVKTGGYFLPVRIEVVRKSEIGPGDMVAFELTLL